MKHDGLGVLFVPVPYVHQVRCVCISKEDFRSCMNEKKFQEVLENVAYQRATYRERREKKLQEEKSPTAVTTTVR